MTQIFNHNPDDVIFVVMGEFKDEQYKILIRTQQIYDAFCLHFAQEDENGDTISIPTSISLQPIGGAKDVWDAFIYTIGLDPNGLD